MRLHHVAVIVPDLERCVGHLEVMGLSCTARHDLAEAGIRVAVLPQGESELHLIQPTGDGGPARFLAQHGASTHHLCFHVDDLEAEVARLVGAGFRSVTAQPVPVGQGTAEIFVESPDPLGFSIQLCGPWAGAGSDLSAAQVARLTRGEP